MTVTGIDDPRIDGPQTTIVTVSVDAANSDDNFDLVPAKTVAVTTTDAGDAAGMALSKTTASVSESGTSDTFTAVLTAQPDSDVVLIVSSGDPQEAAVSPAALTFSPANWNVPQTVTVTGVDDRLIDGSQTTIVTVSVDAANSDDHFDPVPAQTVSVDDRRPRRRCRIHPDQDLRRRVGERHARIRLASNWRRSRTRMWC